MMMPVMASSGSRQEVAKLVGHGVPMLRGKFVPDVVELVNGVLAVVGLECLADPYAQGGGGSASIFGLVDPAQVVGRLSGCSRAI